jgi:hypothetical protein
MIWNIIDRREHPYRWKSIVVVVEPTSHDNGLMVTKPKVAQMRPSTLNEKTSRWPTRLHGLTVCLAASLFTSMTKGAEPLRDGDPFEQRGNGGRLAKNYDFSLGCSNLQLPFKVLKGMLETFVQVVASSSGERVA